MRDRSILHPVLFALFPPLFILSTRMGELWPDLFVLEMAAMAALAYLCWHFLGLALRSREKAAVLLSLFLLLFFSYAHLGAVWPLAAGLGLLAAYYVVRSHRPPAAVTSFLNLMATGLVVIAGAIAIISWLVGTAMSQQTAIPQDLGMGTGSVTDPASLPDIYYIILDAYARADVLEDLYGFDNSEFVHRLQERGFYVAQKSNTNYAYTTLSLACSLNMEYLDALAVYSRRRMIQESRVLRFLRQYGYKIVAFRSDYRPVDLRSADVRFAPPWTLDSFHVDLLHMTPIPAGLAALTGYDRYDFERKAMLYTLEHLAQLPDQGQPMFVFAHVSSPHPPFVFGANGEKVNPQGRFARGAGRSWRKKVGFTEEDYHRHYSAEVSFLNGKVLDTLDKILARADGHAVIVLQADHGPGSRLDLEDPENTDMRERFAILNAYFLPNSDGVGLYDDISPVNTFRVILNHYFGTDHQLLPDESYFSTASQPSQFISVSSEIR